MKLAFSILVVAALLIGSSSAEAARGTAAGNSNLMGPSTPPISSTPLAPPISSTPLTPHTNPVGGVGASSPPFTPQTNPIGGAGTGQSFGALPGNPGSPTFDPNAELNNAVTGATTSP